MLLPHEDVCCWWSHRLAQGAAGTVGVPGHPTSRQGQGRGICFSFPRKHKQLHTCVWRHPADTTSPTTLLVLFLLWLLFKDSMGTSPWWATPAKWDTSFCFMPMERRGVQLGCWWDKSSGLCPQPGTTTQRVLVQWIWKGSPRTGWGPAPGGSEMLTAYSLASVFLISVFTNLTHTRTQMLFLTSENKFVGNFFLLAKSCGEMTSYID